MFDDDGFWENNTITDPVQDLDASDKTESQDSEEKKLCDCDPKYKESQTIQRSTGANFGGFGGQVGDGTTVIICTNCGGRFYEEEYEGSTDGFGSII